MTAAHARPSCCRERATAAHHDRLLRVDRDPEVLLELMELAVTWHELDYGRCAVIGPAAWAGFVDEHDWTDRERAERAFGLALDVVGRGRPGGPATVLELVRD